MNLAGGHGWTHSAAELPFRVVDCKPSCVSFGGFSRHGTSFLPNPKTKNGGRPMLAFRSYTSFLYMSV